MKKIFQYVWLLLLGLPTLTLAAVPPTLQNLDLVGKGSGYQQSDIKMTIVGIIQVLLGFIGIVFFILILWGGFQWMTSGGNEKKIEDAKKRLTSATIGLVLVLMSYAIARSINLWLAAAVGNGATSNAAGSGSP